MTHDPEYVTFSKNIFIPVTNVCRNSCKYCGFRRAVNSKDAYLLSEEDIRNLFEMRRGATEALFTFGESPDVFPLFKSWLEMTGFTSTIEYLVYLSRIAIDHGLLPHTNIGSLSYDELEILKPYNASMGLMLESTATLDAHKDSPGKEPTARIKTIEDAGRLKIPFTTGLLIGIGESSEDRIDSLNMIGDLYKSFGHIQEVILQPFTPKPDTPMSNHASPSFEIFKEIVSTARDILPKDVPIQVPPNLVSPYELVRCGASDLGGISELTIDYINPESGWPSEDELRQAMKEITLKERLPIYPTFIKKEWYGKFTEGLIKRYANKSGLRASL
ncbi:MAG: 7,8-didemethyl-8-hydroxy-5-deazariboflavin synthase subunit CofG, partial [Halobacteriota archaeon]|nr:7,8-didemethyl-8-hydroxy-5-deazariboflavin synthase subunit CofG [Halobacteriota archaeon]